MDARRPGLLVVLFVVAASFVNMAVSARRLVERDLPVMSHFPAIIPTIRKPSSPAIPMFNFPGFPKIGLPEFPKLKVPGEQVAQGPQPSGVPTCPEILEAPQAPEQSLVPELPHHYPETEESKVLKIPKVLVEPKASELPPITESEEPKVPESPKLPPTAESEEPVPGKQEEPVGSPKLPTTTTLSGKLETIPFVMANSTP